MSWYLIKAALNARQYGGVYCSKHLRNQVDSSSLGIKSLLNIFFCNEPPFFEPISYRLVSWNIIYAFHVSDVAIATELERERARNNLTMDEAVKETEDTGRPKGLFREFLYDVNPIGEEDWTNANLLFKFILIIRSPAMFLLQLFIPLVNTTAAKQGW